ncbi:MAG: diacylglycerol kinase [Burkholderiales bacterium]|nr:diacylglycerol kinase [Burkholderiales bacterium]
MSAPPTVPEAIAHRLADAEWFVVQNPGSGPSESGEKRAVVEQALASLGRRHRFIPVGAGGVLVSCQLGAQWAAASGGVLVAAGGDGTVNCAAQAALQHRCPLAVVPQGTFNLFARDHGIPLDPAEAVRAIESARPEPVQVGLVNQRVFLANAAVGLYPKLLEDRETRKEQLGRRRRWIALAASLQSLLQWRWDMRLEMELDGELQRMRTPSVFVCNNRSQLAAVGIADASVDDVGRGQLAAVISRPMQVGGRLQLAWDALTGRLGESEEIECRMLRSLALTTRSARRLKVATDGEVQWMQLPLRFTVSPRPLVLMVPR